MSARPREGWIDIAKGIAIILVVLYHAAVCANFVDLAGPWQPLGLLLASFRMPLFFFTAGVFAAKAIGFDFRDLFRRRVARLLWIYLVWSVVFFVVFQFAPDVSQSHPPRVSELLAIPVWPNESTWFVYALALFFLLGWLMRRWPVWTQFLPPLVLAVAFGTNWVSSGSDAVDRMGMYWICFVAAVHGGPWVRRQAPRIRFWHLLVATALFGIAMQVVYRNAAVISLPFTRLITNLLAISVGVIAAVLLSRRAHVDWLRRLGRNTLQVYLLHFYPILFACALLAPVAGRLEKWTLLIPPALTVLGLFAALAIHAATKWVPGLYALPRRWEARPVAERAGSVAPERAVSSD